MTEPTAPNEAADRLREAIIEHKEPETNAELILLDAALRTERLRVVEQIRAWKVRYERSEATVWAENSPDSLEGLLDAVAGLSGEEPSE